MVSSVPGLIADAPVIALLPPLKEAEGEVIIGEIYGASIENSHSKDNK
jgi:hypothetical protein